MNNIRFAMRSTTSLFRRTYSSSSSVGSEEAAEKMRKGIKNKARVPSPPPSLTRKESETILLGEDSIVNDSALVLASDQKEKVTSGGGDGSSTGDEVKVVLATGQKEKEVKVGLATDQKEVTGGSSTGGDQFVIADSDDSASVFFTEFAGAVVGDAKGGAFFYKLMEGTAVTFACIQVVKGLYKSSKNAAEAYLQKGIKIQVMSPTHTLYVFDMEGVKEGTVHAWVDGENVLHVSGLQLKNKKYCFMGRRCKLPNGYVSINATHYTLLKCVVVSVVNARETTKAKVVKDDTIGAAESKKQA